jgi:hypothetical protein
MLTKKTAFAFMALATLCLAALACGQGGQPAPLPTVPASLLKPGVTSLWEDVPTLPGSIPDVQKNGMLSNFSPNMLTMIYYARVNPADLVAFYTNDLMSKSGWSPQTYAIVNQFSVGNGQGPQISTSSTDPGCSLAGGKALCTFSKVDDQGRDIELTITMKQDSNSNQMQLIYVREVSAAKK